MEPALVVDQDPTWTPTKSVPTDLMSEASSGSVTATPVSTGSYRTLLSRASTPPYNRGDRLNIQVAAMAAANNCNEIDLNTMTTSLVNKLTVKRQGVYRSWHGEVVNIDADFLKSDAMVEYYKDSKDLRGMFMKIYNFNDGKSGVKCNFIIHTVAIWAPKILRGHLGT